MINKHDVTDMYMILYPNNKQYTFVEQTQNIFLNDHICKYNASVKFQKIFVVQNMFSDLSAIELKIKNKIIVSKPLMFLN